MKLLHISDKELTAAQIRNPLQDSVDTKLSYCFCPRTVDAAYTHASKNEHDFALLDLPLKQCSSLGSCTFLHKQCAYF